MSFVGKSGVCCRAVGEVRPRAAPARCGDAAEPAKVRERLYTLKICSFLSKVIAIQSGWVFDHCSWLTSASA